MKNLIATITLSAALFISLSVQAQGFGMPGGHRMPNACSKVGNVCVSVQPPRWVAPSIVEDYGKERVSMLDTHNPLLIWTPAALSGSKVGVTYSYDLKIVMVMPGQAPDHAIDHNLIVFQVKQLIAPQCLLPRSVVNAITADDTYVAQVTAHACPAVTKGLDNKGKSELLLFSKRSESSSAVKSENEQNVVLPHTPSYKLSK